MSISPLSVTLKGSAFKLNNIEASAEIRLGPFHFQLKRYSIIPTKFCIQVR